MWRTATPGWPCGIRGPALHLPTSRASSSGSTAWTVRAHGAAVAPAWGWLSPAGSRRPTAGASTWRAPWARAVRSRWCCHFLVASPPEAQTPLLEADQALVADHEVVEHLAVEQPAGRHDLVRDRPVLGRGRAVATNMGQA